VICYRHCEYNTPVRSSFQPQRRPGRYHRGVEEEPTQYLCLHPLGAQAEALRRIDARTVAKARALDLRIWAIDVPLDELVELPFADAWVGDDYAPCQDLAATLRESDRPGAIVPSAALPGTQNVVLFGGRAAAPYQGALTRPTEVQASIAGEHGCALETLVPLVRFRGQRHPGADFVFREPSWVYAYA